jgi:predicted O-methyltransferase YrrM
VFIDQIRSRLRPRGNRKAVQRHGASPDVGLRQVGWLSTLEGESQDRNGPIPWLTYAAVDFLDQIVSPEATVLEIGAGASTRFWVQRGNHVVALEGDLTYCASLADSLDTARCQLIHVSSSDAVRDLCRSYGSLGQTFDVVIADAFSPRGLYLADAASLVRPSGILVVDNADREEVSQALPPIQEQGFYRLDFFGIGPINKYAWLTTILCRNSSLFSFSRRRSYDTIVY